VFHRPSSRFSHTSPYRPALGIDIGQHSIKAVLLENSPSGFVLREAVQIPTPEGALHEGVIVRKREVAALLQQTVRGFSLAPDSASIAIPLEHSLIRWIELPHMDREALRAATRFEARKYLPYPVEKAAVQISTVEEDVVEEGRMHALLSAAPEEIVRSHAETLEWAGLEVASVEPEAFALVRALRASDNRENRWGSFWHGQPTSYLHLGEEVSGLCIVQDSRVRFMRAVAWGGARLSAALAQADECTREQAIAILQTETTFVDDKGVCIWRDKNGRRTLENAASELERLGREIQRLLNYYRSLFPERSYEGLVQRIVLSGGTAGLKGLARYFTRAFQIDTIIGEPFQSLAHRLAQELPVPGGRHSAVYAVAVGLAQAELMTQIEAQERENRDARELIWRREAA
jgi:type IV pilus assembly protein PilM